MDRYSITWCVYTHVHMRTHVLWGDDDDDDNNDVPVNLNTLKICCSLFNIMYYFSYFIIMFLKNILPVT
jgi:hypothetical protein